ncbi:MAG: hypothetical protein O2960_30195 [Verrucomicrobia bacterium]|nr:hypothetical protein [Verrucomicrobiota bacterium]
MSKPRRSAAVRSTRWFGDLATTNDSITNHLTDEASQPSVLLVWYAKHNLDLHALIDANQCQGAHQYDRDNLCAAVVISPIVPLNSCRAGKLEQATDGNVGSQSTVLVLMRWNRVEGDPKKIAAHGVIAINERCFKGQLHVFPERPE